MRPFASYTRGFDHVGVLGTYVDLNRLVLGRRPPNPIR